MYFDTKKKEFVKNGKLSILKIKKIKMDYPKNVHQSDNDIFEVRKRVLNLKKTVKKEDLVEKKIRVYFIINVQETSPYLNGKRNEKFKPTQILSNIVLGDDKVKSAIIKKNTVKIENNDKKEIKVKSNSSSSCLKYKSSNYIKLEGNNVDNNEKNEKKEKKFKSSSSFIEKTPVKVVINNDLKSSNKYNTISENEDPKNKIIMDGKINNETIEIVSEVKSKSENKKSRNVVNKLYKTPVKQHSVDVFGNKTPTDKMMKSAIYPKKLNLFISNTSLDSNIKEPCFNIITNKAKIHNKSQSCVLANGILDTVHVIF